MKSHLSPKEFLESEDEKIRSSFLPPSLWKFDVAGYLDKTRYFLRRINSLQTQLDDTARCLGE
jgi:hypothetical protein